MKRREFVKQSGMLVAAVAGAALAPAVANAASVAKTKEVKLPDYLADHWFFTPEGRKHIRYLLDTEYRPDGKMVYTIVHKDSVPVTSCTSDQNGNLKYAADITEITFVPKGKRSVGVERISRKLQVVNVVEFPKLKNTGPKVVQV